MFEDIKQKLFGPQKEKLETVNDQPKEDIDLCAFVKSKIEEVRTQSNRVSQEGIWMTNIAYLLGFDSIYYDPTLKQFRPIGRANGYIRRNRIHSNILLPAVQNRTARMCKNPPKYDVRPNSQEEDDKEAARLGVEIIGMLWDKQSINRKRIDLSMWLQQCGHAYMKVSYDDQLGEELTEPLSGSFMGFEGDVRADIVSAFEGFADPMAKTFDECSWFGQAKVRKLDYFRSHYDRGDLVKEEAAWLLSAQYEMRINTLNSAGQSSSNTQEQMKNSAIELSYYERRSKRYPKGRHIIVANGVLLKNDDLPYGEIPFAKFDDVIIGGKYNSESLVTHARPIQDQYNRTLVKRAEWVNKLLAGKYIAAKQHGLAQEALNDQAGEVVEYDPVPNAPEPHAMQIPTIPQYAYTESDNLKREIYEIFGISDIARGQLPSASIPAQGMQILLEQDETRIGIEVEQHEHAWARVGKLLLKCAAKNYVTTRKLKTRGKNDEYKVKEFTGEMIRNNFDVTVIRGSTIPNVKTVARNDIMNAFQSGLLGDPADPVVREMVLGMMEFGDIGGVWEEYRSDMTQIQKTISQIEQGQIPLVNRLDNHKMHVLVKNRYRKSDKFDRLSPEAQDIMIHDIDAHITSGAVLMNPAIAQPMEDPLPEMAVDGLNAGIDLNAQPMQNGGGGQVQ